MSSTAPNEADLRAVAEAFALPAAIRSIAPLGNGNVNDTFLVETGEQRYVLQRLNTQVFRQPELVMQNLQVLDRHVQQRLQALQDPAASLLAGRRWVLPQVVCTRADSQACPCLGKCCGRPLAPRPS